MWAKLKSQKASERWQPDTEVGGALLSLIAHQQQHCYLGIDKVDFMEWNGKASSFSLKLNTFCSISILNILLNKEQSETVEAASIKDLWYNTLFSHSMSPSSNTITIDLSWK